MARASLIPGFRFHPTDVELIMYFLKRKILGKKLHFDAIAEVNIYKFSPWDLPDKSALKSRDLEWFFFCPVEKKYARGARVKRKATNGYWKATGKDRPVSYNRKTVGTVRTLVFHLGPAPNGQRTDWVIHEYRILDEELKAAEVQDNFVLCKLFKKNGPGPKLGAQYGAPFNEDDWADDDAYEAQDNDTSSRSEGPVHATPIMTGDGSSVGTGLFPNGSTSRLPLIEKDPSPSIKELLMDENFDEIEHLLAHFEGGSSFIYSENGLNQDHLNGKERINTAGYDYNIYKGLADLDGWAPTTTGGGSLEFSKVQQDELDFSVVHEDHRYSLEHHNMVLPHDGSFIELDDLQMPLDNLDGFYGTEKSAVEDTFVSYSHANAHNLCCTQGSFASVVDQPVSAETQLPGGF